MISIVAAEVRACRPNRRMVEHDVLTPHAVSAKISFARPSGLPLPKGEGRGEGEGTMQTELRFLIANLVAAPRAMSLNY